MGGGDIPPPPHSPLNIGLILSCVFTFIITTIFNALAGSGGGVGSVFYATVGDISDKFELFITPAGFTFSIWSLIYLWLALGLLYFVVTIFIKTDFGRLYLSPQILTPSVTITLSLNFILNLAWIFIWDRSFNNENLTILASIFLVFIAVTNILVIVFMTRNLGKHNHEFQRGGTLFWWGALFRFVLNGLAIYTTWTVIASLVNLATALVYAGGVDQREAALASLSLLVIIHCTWFVLENFLLDYYVRYILTQYLVVIWAANGIRSKINMKKTSDELETVPEDVENFVLAILVIASLTFLVRVGIVVYRVVRKPLTKMTTVSVLSTK